MMLELPSPIPGARLLNAWPRCFYYPKKDADYLQFVLARVLARVFSSWPAVRPNAQVVLALVSFSLSSDAKVQSYDPHYAIIVFKLIKVSSF